MAINGNTFCRLNHSTAREFLNAIERLDDSSSNRGICWRGVGNSEYLLVPAAERDTAIELLNAFAKLDTGELIDVSGAIQQTTKRAIVTAYMEYAALIHFCRRVNCQGLPIPTWVPDQLYKEIDRPTDESFLASVLGKIESAARWWPPPGYWPTLALAQHYGIPTRALDWTDDPRVAAYFAGRAALDGLRLCKTTEQEIPNLSVWMLNRTVFERLEYIASGRLCVDGKPLAIELECELHVVRAPYSGNPNLAAQRGLFTLVSTKNTNSPRLCLTDAMSRVESQLLGTRAFNFVVGTKARSISEHVARFDLPQSEAPELLRLLARRGYDAARLFPEYGGAAMSAVEIANASIAAAARTAAQNRRTE